MIWNAACIGFVCAEAQVIEFLPSSAYGHEYCTLLTRSLSGRLQYLLLSTHLILVCFLLPPDCCARRLLMIWNAACLGLVSAEAQV